MNEINTSFMTQILKKYQFKMTILVHANVYIFFSKNGKLLLVLLSILDKYIGFKTSSSFQGLKMIRRPLNFHLMPHPPFCILYI